MNCLEFARLIEAGTAAQPTGPLEEHASHCPRCRALLEMESALGAIALAVPAVAVPAGLADAVMDRWAEEAPPTGWLDLLSWSFRQSGESSMKAWTDARATLEDSLLMVAASLRGVRTELDVAMGAVRDVTSSSIASSLEYTRSPR